MMVNSKNNPFQTITNITEYSWCQYLIKCYCNRDDLKCTKNAIKTRIYDFKTKNLLLKKNLLILKYFIQ